MKFGKNTVTPKPAEPQQDAAKVTDESLDKVNGGIFRIPKAEDIPVQKPGATSDRP